MKTQIMPTLIREMIVLGLVALFSYQTNSLATEPVQEFKVSELNALVSQLH